MGRKKAKVGFLDAVGIATAHPEVRKEIFKTHREKRDKEKRAVKESDDDKKEVKDKREKKEKEKRAAKGSNDDKKEVKEKREKKEKRAAKESDDDKKSARPSDSKSKPEKSDKSSKPKSPGKRYPRPERTMTDSDQQSNRSDSFLDPYLYSGHGSHREDRSSLPLLDDRPGTAPFSSRPRSRVSKPHKTPATTRTTLKDLGRQLFGTSKSEKKDSSDKKASKTVDSSETSRSGHRSHRSQRHSRARPHHPRPMEMYPEEEEGEEEEAEFLPNANFNPSRISGWVQDVDGISLAASGFARSEGSRNQPYHDGYHFNTFPTRSDFESDSGSEIETVVPNDSVSVRKY